MLNGRIKSCLGFWWISGLVDKCDDLGVVEVIYV